MQRRDFLAVTGLAAFGTVTAATAAEPAAAAPLRTGPYLQNPTPEGMSVLFMTAEPAVAFVEYGPTASLGLRATACEDGLRDAGGRMHRVRLAGLKPGTRYFYRVVTQPIVIFQPYRIAFAPEVASPIYDFATPDPAASRVRFLVYNDLHDNVDLWKGLHSLVADEPVDFVFLNGDVVDYLQDEAQMVGHFLDVCTSLFATRVPFLYARGNHETRGAWSRQMKGYLDLPGDRYFYAFSQGPARFVVLDSGEDKPDDAPVYAGLADFDAYRSAQRDWLAREVVSEPFKSAKYRIAIHHIPAPLGTAAEDGDRPTDHGAIDSRDKWWPLFNANGIDLFLGGHTHRPVLRPADPAAGHAFPVMIGGGPRKGIGTVMLVDADADRVLVKMLRDDGTTIATLEV